MESPITSTIGTGAVTTIDVAKNIIISRTGNFIPGTVNDDYSIIVTVQRIFTMPDGSLITKDIPGESATLSKILSDSSVQTTFPALKDIIIRIMKGELKNS